MKVKVSLSVGGDLAREEVLEMDDVKFMELTEDEKEQAIEINIREWANRLIQIEWEVTS